MTTFQNDVSHYLLRYRQPGQGEGVPSRHSLSPQFHFLIPDKIDRITYFATTLHIHGNSQKLLDCIAGPQSLTTKENLAANIQ